MSNIITVKATSDKIIYDDVVYGYLQNLMFGSCESM